MTLFQGVLQKPPDKVGHFFFPPMHPIVALTKYVGFQLKQQVQGALVILSIGQQTGVQGTMDILPEQLEEGRRILVFSQFTRMIALIEDELIVRDIGYSKLTGQTKKRDEAIEHFKSGAVNVFLISLKAGGVGLNLTEADTVIIYDPWWNPAVEAQAIDRSHRIGQTQTVNAYRLIAPGTVEEKIWELQQSKAQTIADVLGEEGFARSLSKTDLEYLFSED